MRKSMIALAVLATATLFGARAEAVEYPYCVTATEGWGAYIERCDFSTMEQCQMTARGSNGTCSTNWRLQFTRPDQQSQPVRRRGY
jgi:hypothetical protein